MNILQNQIERYLFNEMTPEEEQEFLSRIESDPHLKEEVEMTALIIGATSKVGKKEDLADIQVLLQANLSEVQELTEQKKRKPILKTMTWIASSVAVILMAVLFINYNKQNNNINHLYSSYYQPYEADARFSLDRDKLRGSFVITKEDSTLLMKGMILYENQKYSEALNYFNQISKRYDSNQYILHKSICLLEIGEAEKAVQVLEAAINENSKRWKYYQDAEWYLALAYIKTKRIKEAKSLLHKIGTDNVIYAKKAIDILRDL